MTKPKKQTKLRKGRSASKALVRSAADPIDALYKAACAYVEHNGGKVAVIGGVSILQWPEDGEHRYTLGLKITGKKPGYASNGAFSGAPTGASAGKRG